MCKSQTNNGCHVVDYYQMFLEYICYHHLNVQKKLILYFQIVLGCIPIHYFLDPFALRDFSTTTQHPFVNVIPFQSSWHNFQVIKMRFSWVWRFLPEKSRLYILSFRPIPTVFKRLFCKNIFELISKDDS